MINTYKTTLHLPETTFAMRAELAKREPEFLKAWEVQNLYQSVRQARVGAKKFILHDGPPYANGTLHVGHAANKILKDIIMKAARLRGLDAPFVPGWDCHGLPIELVVEKKWGKVGVQVDGATFRQYCRDYAVTQISQQREDLKRLGVLGDWDRPYITMDFAYEANIIRSLAKIYNAGRIYKGYKPVHWCLECASSLAEAEVEYQDKISDSIYVKFECIQARNTHSLKEFVLIWTTTPWTLPANQAVAARSDITYVLLQVEKEAYWLAKDLIEVVFPGIPFIILDEKQGSELSGQMLKHCFLEETVPIILGDHVTTEAGTGFVHTAPAHGVDDFQVCQKQGLVVKNVLASNGCFVEGTPYFSGLHVSKANPRVLEVLTEKGNLLRHEKIKHSYPHCWRHKTPLIFRATPQWFIKMEGLLPESVEAAEKVQFIPEAGRNRFLSMLAGRPDWCISRQRHWGVPIAFFIHRETTALHPETASIMQRVAEDVEKEGVEAWFSAKPEDYGVDSLVYEKVADILDVWFDSGASSLCVLSHSADLGYPADLYLEGSDQHRGWFQTSLLTAMAAGKPEAPFRQILTHGFLVDGQGRKMSKSIGNVVTIQEAVNQYGADILRLWVSMSDYTGEISFSSTVMGQVQDVYRKIRNTLRYLLAALHGFSLEDSTAHAEMLEVDQFMIEKAYEVQDKVKILLSAEGSYSIREAMMAVYDFCEDDLSNVYFDVLKDRLYTESAENRRSAQRALWQILHVLLRMISPVLSFTADEAWQLMREKGYVNTADESIFTTLYLGSDDFYQPKRVGAFQAETGLSSGEKGGFNRAAWQAAWPILKAMRAELNKQLDLMRKNKEIGSNLDVDLYFPMPADDFFQNPLLVDELKYFFITSSCTDGAFNIQISPHQKCSRCWHHQPDVSMRSHLVDHPEEVICNRCEANLTGQSKRRIYF